ncbi:MAG: hypothetical protein ACO3A2_05510, partial [Bdellovibrionia bacterium]
FLILMWGAHGIQPATEGSSFGSSTHSKMNFLWLVGCTWIYTVGELYLSPIGLSLVTKIAPARLVSMLMGVWLMSSFFGNYLSGYLGTYYEKMSQENFFLLLAALGGITSLALFSLQRPLKKALGESSIKT